MQTLVLEPLWHRDQLCIAIRGWLEKEAFQVVNRFTGRLYSKTHRCYYVPYEPESLRKLRQVVRHFFQDSYLLRISDENAKIEKP